MHFITLYLINSETATGGQETNIREIIVYRITVCKSGVNDSGSM